MKHTAPFIDRVNDHIADSARYVGPILIVLGLGTSVVSFALYLWKHF
jgi:hypothetical protein